MKYKCNECGSSFTEPIEVETSYESIYGVSDSFGSSNKCKIKSCPYCYSADVEEEEEEEEEDV